MSKVCKLLEIHGYANDHAIKTTRQQTINKNLSMDSLKVNKTAVPTSNFIKYLGVYLDQQHGNLYNLQQRGFTCYQI